jgi:hypothetical protein
VNHKLAAVIATATLAATVLSTTALVLPRETAPPLSCGRQARLDPTKLSAVPSLQWATDGSVEAVLPCGETVFVGGGFDVIGPYTGSFASVSPRTGVADVGATALHRPVDAIVSDGDGGWVVAMTSEGAAVGARHCAPIVHLRADGSVAWRIAACPHAVLNALARAGSVVYVGGQFETVADRPRSNAAAVDIRTGKLTRWNPRVGGARVWDRDEPVPREVNAIEARDGRVFLGGFFNRVGGVRRVNLAVVDPGTGDVLEPVTDVGDGWDDVRDLEVANGRLYFGGQFARVGHAQRTNAAAIDVRTGRVLGWDPRLRGGPVEAVAARPGAILLAGRFTASRGLGRSGVMAASTGSGAPLPWGPRLTGRTPDWQIEDVLDVEGRVLVVGGFASVDHRTQPYAALIDDHGKLTNWNAGPAGPVHAAAYDGRRIALGGKFAGVGAVRRSSLAAFDARTGRLRPWAPSVNGWVGTLAVDGERLYVGGAFTRVGTKRRNNLAAFARPTLRLAPWRLDVVGQSVDALEVAGSTIFVGGDFEAVGGRPRPAVAAVGTSDARLLDLTPELQPKEGFVRPMVTGILHAEGTLFVQGFIAPSGVVALDDRTGAERWAAVTDMSGIDAFARAGGRLVSGGFFTTVSSATADARRDGVAVLDADTGDLLPWEIHPKSVVGIDYLGVRPGVAATDRWVLVGGDFTSVDGKPRNGLAAVAASRPRIAAWHPLVGGVPLSPLLGPTLYIDPDNDASLAAFTRRQH